MQSYTSIQPPLLFSFLHPDFSVFSHTLNNHDNNNDKNSMNLLYRNILEIEISYLKVKSVITEGEGS